jgi:hypothetical protein
MKKLIQICAMLSLVFVVSVISASAQTVVKQYDAKIPFEFNIGEKSFQAGSYSITISRLSSNGMIVSLEDKERNTMQTVMVAENGNHSKSAPQLVFDNQGSTRYLTGIATREVGVSIIAPKNDKGHNVKKQQPAARTQIASASAAPAPVQ